MWRRSVADGGVVLFRVRLLKRLVQLQHQLPRRTPLNVVNVDGYHNSPSDAPRSSRRRGLLLLGP